MNAMVLLAGLMAGQVSQAELAIPQAPPAAEAIVEARKTLREIHGDRLDTTEKRAAAGLAGELLDAGRAVTDSPASQWVCWDEARRLALLAGDRPRSFEAVQLLAEAFRYPEPADQAECIRRARDAWKEADSKKGDQAWPWRLAAWAWYTQAGGNGELNGLNKVEAEKRIGEVEGTASVPEESFKETAPTTRLSSRAWLDDLQESAGFVGDGVVSKHGDRTRELVRGPDGREHALFTHPPTNGAAYVTYDLDRKYTWFNGYAVIPKRPEEPRSTSPVVFSVWGDDRLLWKSRPMQANGEWRKCRVSIRGVNKLRLQVNCYGPHFWCWAAWYQPEIVE